MTALGFLVIGDYGDALVPHTLLIGQILLSIAAVITLMTGFTYLRAGWKHL
jgi:phosphatidylglycerophosphate synthase